MGSKNIDNEVSYKDAEKPETKKCDYCGRTCYIGGMIINFSECGQSIDICAAHPTEFNFWKWLSNQLYDELDAEFVKSKRMDEALRTCRETAVKVTTLVDENKYCDACFLCGMIEGTVNMCIGK